MVTFMLASDKTRLQVGLPLSPARPRFEKLPDRKQMDFVPCYVESRAMFATVTSFRARSQMQSYVNLVVPHATIANAFFIVKSKIASPAGPLSEFLGDPEWVCFRLCDDGFDKCEHCNIVPCSVDPEGDVVLAGGGGGVWLGLLVLRLKAGFVLR